MAKQTFTTGQVLTAAQMTSLQQTAMLGGAANAKVASYVLVAADAGDAITMSNASPTTITVNTGLFAAGDIVTIINLGAGACTITAGTATVDTSGSLVLATNQGGVLRFTSASAAIFFQFATPASGDIEGVTAGTGISGGGTSGTVTITNSMATAIDAKGDLVVGTGADTFSRLAVGTNGHTLVADSSESTGLKWAAPASGGGMTLLSTTTLSGSSTSISITGTGYIGLYISLTDWGQNADGRLSWRFNSDTGNNYYYVGQKLIYTTANTFSSAGSTNSLAIDNNSESQTNKEQILEIMIPSSEQTVANKVGQWRANYRNSAEPGSPPNIETAMFCYTSTSAISNITFISPSGNFGGGQVLVYGVK